MLQIVIEREDLREVVRQTLERACQEISSMSQRISELVNGFRFDDKVYLHAQVYLAQLVDPYVSYLLGEIGYEGLLDVYKIGLADFANMETRRNEGSSSVELSEDIAEYMVNSVFPKSSEERIVRYFNNVFSLAEEMGLNPRDVLKSDDVYHEVLRRTYASREEFSTVFESMCDSLKAEALENTVVDEVLRKLGLNDDDMDRMSEVYMEELEEIRESIKDSIRETQDMEDMIQAFRAAISQAKQEWIDEVFGQGHADSPHSH